MGKGVPCRRSAADLCSRCLALALLVAAAAAAAAEPVVLSDLDEPFLFAYGSWQDRAVIREGIAYLDADGLTPRGGAGFQLSRDLSAEAERTPALRLRALPGNTLQTIALLVIDGQQGASRYEFAVPDPAVGWVTVPANEGASLAQPAKTEKGIAAKPADVTQLQLGGDWRNDEPVKVQVDRIELLEADAAITQARADRTQRLADEAARLAASQADELARYGGHRPSSPWIDHYGAVAPDILAVEIRAQSVQPSKLERYQAQDGDERVTENGDGAQPSRVAVRRGGQELGSLIGPQRDWLVTNESLTGDPLLVFLADDPAQWSLLSADDPAYANATAPLNVWRKSKPVDWCQSGDKGFAMRHTVYLKLPAPLLVGRSYVLAGGQVNLREAETRFSFSPDGLRSEALHVSQIGFRPNDPLKVAYASTWLGTGGALRYSTPPRFHVVGADGTSVLTGTAELVLDVDGQEKLAREDNFAKTAVYRLDLGGLRQPGTYKVVLDGIGCSYPFPLADDVWQRAFGVQLQGLLNQHSGQALGPPYTEFRKPRDLHPADGQAVTWLTKSKPELPTEFADAAADSKRTEPGAWGGYHDAGDWNPRRVSHLRVTQALLELLEIRPDYAAKLDWPMPDRDANLPALLQEALWEIDLFGRLQQPDGGVSYGIEATGDPLPAEVSWLQSQPEYVFAPDLDSSYQFAAAAARAANLLRDHDRPRADALEAKALAAMTWAEARRAERLAAGDEIDWTWTDHRNFAAVQLLGLTRDRHWQTVFAEDSCLAQEPVQLFAWGHHVQVDAAFAYARLDPELTDPLWRQRAVDGLVAQADSALRYAAGNSFGLTTPDPGKPQFLGFYTVPDAVELARAHFLTGRSEYLAGVVQACQFSLGANPGNWVFTTGLGANPILHPLKLDSRLTGQPAPAGLTPYGMVDLTRWNDNWIIWPITWHLSKVVTPDPYAWPIPEAYWDIHLAPAFCEYTVDTWAPKVHAWGYLAGQP